MPFPASPTWKSSPTYPASPSYGADARPLYTFTVQAGSSLGTLPAAMTGIELFFDEDILADARAPQLLQAAGVTMLGLSSKGDKYIWSPPLNNNLAIAAANGLQYAWMTTGYGPPTGDFLSSKLWTIDELFNKVLSKISPAPLLRYSVNYGSNAAGNAGGALSDAEALLSYVNVTHGPALGWPKITHVGISYEVYGPDGKALHPDALIGRDSLNLNATKTPEQYAADVLTWSTGLKGVDSSIKILVNGFPEPSSPANPFLASDDASGLSWNNAVLANCGSTVGGIDGIEIHVFTELAGALPDLSLATQEANLARIVKTVQAQINGNCGSNAGNVGIYVDSFNPATYVTPTNQCNDFPAGACLPSHILALLEAGVQNVTHFDLADPPDPNYTAVSNTFSNLTGATVGLVSQGKTGPAWTEPAAGTPYPMYWGLALLQYAGKPGDTMVAVTPGGVGSSGSAGGQPPAAPFVTCHATKGADGKLRVLLSSRDSMPQQVQIKATGFAAAGTGAVYSAGYGAQGGIQSSALAGVSLPYTVTLPPYTAAVYVFN